MNRSKKRVSDARRAAPRQSLQARALEVLSHRLNKVERAIDTNTSVFSDTMKMLEVQMHVVHEVLSMVHEDGHGLVSLPDGKIDFNYYTKRYLDRLIEVEEKKEEAPVAPVLATTDDESPTIFGGDGT